MSAALEEQLRGELSVERARVKAVRADSDALRRRLSDAAAERAASSSPSAAAHAALTAERCATRLDHRCVVHRSHASMRVVRKHASSKESRSQRHTAMEKLRIVTVGIPGGRSLTRPFCVDSPLRLHPVLNMHVHERRESLGFVHRLRTIFCRPC